MGPIGDWALDKDRMIQVSQPVRGDYSVRFYRGLRSTSLEFTAARLFTTISEAEAFCLTHEETLPARGTVKMTTYAGAGGGSTLRTIANCELLRVRCIPDGRTVLIQYAFAGGKIS
jgi:hypothetical protein